MTKRLGDVSFVSILPEVLRDDTQLRAAAASLDNLLHRTTNAVPNLLIWARLDRERAVCIPPLQRLVDAAGGLKPLSTELLELFAWQFHVDFREVATNDAQLSRMVRESIPWHRIKGTPASLKAALGLFGYYGIKIEEDGLDQHWATYQLGLPQIADTPTVQHIVKICNEMAPVRCRLWRIYTDAYDRRPIILSHGPVLSDGWLSYHSGVSVPDAPGSEDDVLVSFGTRNAYSAEQAYPRALCASFGSIVHLGFLAPYLDRFIVGRSKLSDVYPRNHGFFMGSLFSILWADRATTGRRWRGEWDARSWLDYTGFDRKLPPWRIERRAISRAQLVPGWGEKFGDCNARLGVTFATLIDGPMRLGSTRLSAHDSQRRELRLHEMFVDVQGHVTPPVHPGVPHVAGVSLLASTSSVPNPYRVWQARHDDCAVYMRQREALPPQEAAHLNSAAQSNSVSPCAAPPSAVTSYLAPLWLGAWNEPGSGPRRTWTTLRKISTQ